MHTFFEWDKIEHKHAHKTTGTAKLKCPACIDTRTNKRDTSLYVRYDSGIAKCFHCEALSFRDSVSGQTERKKFKLPEQVWRNYTKLSDALIKFIEARGIKQFTATKFEASEELFWQPQIGKTVNNLVFNYFEGDILINKKYRDGAKHFAQCKDAKSIFYNINSIIGKKECYIVEGEFDVWSIDQIGVHTVISVPNGANNNDEYWINCEPYLRDIERFYIGTDNDEKGDKLAEDIAQRLGRYRCERILWEGKDANEDLISGVLESSIKNTKKYPVSGTFTINDVYDKVIDLLENGLPPVYYPTHRCFGDMRKKFTCMLGHLVTVTGIPSHGKSNFIEWYVLNLAAEYNFKISFFSPEHQPMEMHQSTFIEKFHAKSFWYESEGNPRIDKINVAEYAEWANEKIYLTSPEGAEVASWDWIFEKFREQMFNFGVNVFVIDAFNKVEGCNTLQDINKVLGRLTNFAQKNNVIIFLIAHPTKMQKIKDTEIYNVPDLYSVSGSADFRNQTHDGLCVYRFFPNEENPEGFTEVYNLKTKMKFQGEIGSSMQYNYHVPSGRYFLKDTEPELERLDKMYRADLRHEKTKEVSEYQLPTISPSEAFNMPSVAFDEQYDDFYNENSNDDVPF